MRVTEVTAHAFGPIVGQTLEFHDGLTVVVGGNESAKSSWHAAVYAAICGRRRGRGATNSVDARFADMHKPWDREEWKVTARLRLDDGTLLDVVQDLAGKVDCRIVELPRGVDRSNELTYDGSVDGSRLVGLNRKAFAATACVAQTDLLGLLENAGALQEMLSKAATSADADESTARALSLIDKFKSEHVGLDRSNSSRPLRAALDAVEDATAALREAKEARADLEARAAGRLIDVAAAARADHDYARAAALAATAAELTDRAGKATALSDRLGPDRPTAAGSHAGLVQVVTAAVSAWRTRPTPVTPTDDVDALTRELSELPALPDHDTAPAATVKQAASAYQRGVALLAAHDSKPERSVIVPPLTGPTSEELRTLAGDLSRLPAAVPATSTVTTPPARTPGFAAAALGAVLAIAGVALSIPALIGVGALVATGGLVWAFTRTATTTTVTDPAAATMAADLTTRRVALEATAASYGVPLDMPAILAAITAADDVEKKATARATWVRTRETLASDVDAAAALLADALTDRGHPCAAADAPAHWEAYETACATAAGQQAAASRRAVLEARLASAEGAQSRYREAVQAGHSAAVRLRSAAQQAAAVLPADVMTLVDDPGSDPDRLAGALDAWTSQVAIADEAAAHSAEEWTTLTGLLGTDTLDQLQGRARAARDAADTAAAGLDPARLAATPVVDAAQLARLATDAANAEGEVRENAGKVAEFAASLPDVSAAEEVLADATAELTRVRALEQVLDKTRAFMAAAQERVHKDIAPALQTRLQAWLPLVTSGRYTEASVNPQTLAVQVRGASGVWRQAALLSHGTAEQVYLLLRLALVEHLTAGHDSCPLLLDDVTVHADTARTNEILTLLGQVAEQRQVVLFTQQDMVADWARANLGGVVGKFIELGEPAPA
jgi:hypothetical protein